MAEGTQTVHHVVFCVRPENLERVRALWGALGLVLEDIDLPDLGLHVLISWTGGIEIMAPTYSDGELAERARRFLDERGEGVYAVVFNVADIDQSMAQLLAQGGELVFQESIPPATVGDRPLDTEGSAAYGIEQALFHEIHGMRICLQELRPVVGG